MSKLENNISILEKRKLQAEVAKSIFEEMKIELGEDKAKKILKNAIIKNAIDEGKKFRKNIDGQTKNNETVIKKFTDVFELWKKGGALEIEEIKKMMMNITSMLRGANMPKCIMKWGLRTLANSYLVIGITIFLLGLTKT